jgi:hypothetical protein
MILLSDMLQCLCIVLDCLFNFVKARVYQASVVVEQAILVVFFDCKIIMLERLIQLPKFIVLHSSHTVVFSQRFIVFFVLIC